MEKKKQKKTVVLNREQLLKKEKLEIVEVDLGKGDVVFVRQMTGRERDNFEQSMLRKVKKPGSNVVEYEPSIKDFRAKLAVNTLCDEEGECLMKPEDYDLLSRNMSAFRLEKIINIAQKLNKISEEDKEEMVKNSEDGQAVSSSSDSVKS